MAMIKEASDKRRLRVYTRQHPAVADTLSLGDVYMVKEEFIKQKNEAISDYYLELYRWLTDKCREAADIPQGASYPIWLSMHDEYRLRPVENTAVLILSIPEDKLRVISEYAWGYRVNYMYIPKDKADEADFNAELKRYQIASEASLISGSEGNYYPMLKQKIIRSWDRLFTLPPLSPEDELGICFELRPEWVESIERY